MNVSAYDGFSIQVSRGCPFDCEFCSVTHAFGRQFRYKPIENIVKEIEFLKKIDRHKRIFFTDDNIISNPEYAKRIFRAIIPLKVRWYSQMPITIARDEELLSLIRASGCQHLVIGFESVTQSSLDAMGKGVVNRVDEYEVAIEKIHSHKIRIFGLFIVNGEYDDETSFAKTLQFINTNNIPAVIFQFLIPFPGTRLFQRVEKENRILHRDWARYNGEHVVFLPKKISPQALEKGFCELWQQTYAYENIYNRLNGLSNKGFFMGEPSNAFCNLGLSVVVAFSFLIYGRFRYLSFFLKCIFKFGRLSLIPVIMNIALRDYAIKISSRVTENT